MSRPVADTMPAVTVPPSPNGLPTATAHSPMRGAWSAKFTYGKPLPSTLMSARSLRGSVPTTVALWILPSSVVTLTVLA